MPIRALPSVYAGVRFRSRLEADWARAFDERRIRWAYEPEGWAFGPGLCYLPDFYLPELRTFVEVKGILDPRSMMKLEALRLAADPNGIMVVLAEAPAGVRWSRVDEETNAAGWGFDLCPECHAAQFFDAGGCRREECRTARAPRPWAECRTIAEQLAWLRWWGRECARHGRIDDAEQFAAEAVRLRTGVV